MALTERQTAALIAVRDNPAATAKEVAEAITPGSDPRGAAQTLRHMPDFVKRYDTGIYYLTDQGRAELEK